MSKLIEIIGSPGSGKTFICNKLQLIKKNNKQFFFHSSNWKNFKKFKRLSFATRFFIRIKVILMIIKFYTFFFKRFFLKKIYKRSFFFRTILLIYRHLISIEMFKKALKNDECLIMEPGLIMYFLQDYFYSNQAVTNKDIKIFNKIFLKADYIIYANCNIKTQIKRLKIRKRGLPQRMANLNNKEIYNTIKKSNNDIKKYVSNSYNLKYRFINVDTSNNFKKIKKLANLFI